MLFKYSGKYVNIHFNMKITYCKLALFTIVLYMWHLLILHEKFLLVFLGSYSFQISSFYGLPSCVCPPHFPFPYIYLFSSSLLTHYSLLMLLSVLYLLCFLPFLLSNLFPPFSLSPLFPPFSLSPLFSPFPFNSSNFPNCYSLYCT